VRLPAIADGGRPLPGETVFGRQTFRARRARASSESERRHGNRQIAALWASTICRPVPRQAPSATGGGPVKAAWFRSKRQTSGRRKFDRLVRAETLPNKASELRDIRGLHDLGDQGKTLTCCMCCASARNPRIEARGVQQCGALRREVVLIRTRPRAPS